MKIRAELKTLKRRVRREGKVYPRSKEPGLDDGKRERQENQRVSPRILHRNHRSLRQGMHVSRGQTDRKTHTQWRKK